MSAPRILVVYGSTYGQTAKIAARIRDRLEAKGCEVVLTRGDKPPHHIPVVGYDAVLVGASLIVGGYQRYIRRFVKTHAETLNRTPSAFFAVCASEGGTDEAARADARRIRDDFLQKAGWRPTLVPSFAGGIAYTRYSPLVRWIMKRISAKEGGATDTSRDHEYTDWARVAEFADDVADLARGVEPRRAPPRRPAAPHEKELLARI